MNLEARKAWEENVFNPAGVDQQALHTYLSDLFAVADPGREKIFEAVTRLRNAVEAFETRLSRHVQFTMKSLKRTIDGLLFRLLFKTPIPSCPYCGRSLTPSLE